MFWRGLTGQRLRAITAGRWTFARRWWRKTPTTSTGSAIWRWRMLRLGDLAFKAQDFAGAAPEFQAALGHCAGLVAANPGNADSLQELGAALDRVGDLATMQGDIVAAQGGGGGKLCLGAGFGGDGAGECRIPDRAGGQSGADVDFRRRSASAVARGHGDLASTCRPKGGWTRPSWVGWRLSRRKCRPMRPDGLPWRKPAGAAEAGLGKPCASRVRRAGRLYRQDGGISPHEGVAG